MIIKDEIEFLNLPDWKKVHLKISYSKFINYRLMTEEQEFTRRQKIYKIASHYGHVDLDILQNDSNITLDNSWPKNVEKFITPKLLDLFNTNWFCKFGYCFFCNYFDGFNKMHFKFFFAKIPKNQTVPFSGRCKHILNRTISNDSSAYGRKRNFVDPRFSCFLWEPMQLYFQIIQMNIANKLDQFNSNYHIRDYVYDLQNVNLWNYFFNKYDRIEY